MTEAWEYCETHGCPMIHLGDEQVCLFDYVDDQLGQQEVTDIVPGETGQAPALVFSNGRILPLLCPHCGEPACMDDEDLDAALEDVAGLYLVGLGYGEVEDGDEFLLLFAEKPDVDTEDPEIDIYELAVHPNSAKQLA